MRALPLRRAARPLTGRSADRARSGHAAHGFPYSARMPGWLTSLLSMLALPEFGLTTLFVAAFISATLLPIGSEPALFGLLKLNPELFWPAVLVATAGNTLGGMVDWWIGYGAHEAVDRYGHRPSHAKALEWLERLGPKACLLAWLPIVGDPLCAVAGWLRLPFWPCAGYMLVGKFLRYVTMTTVLLYLFPGALPDWSR
jgi:membrane protein YqaA with SNARE-associated domain